MSLFHWIPFLALALAPLFQDGDTSTEISGIAVQNASLKTINSTTLSARVPGVIERLEVSEGSPVHPGQLLGNIGDRAVQLQLERARMAVDIAKQRQANDIETRLAEKKLAVARNELSRAESANQRIANSYPAREIERLQLVVDSGILEVERSNLDREMAGMEVRQAELEVAQAEELLERHQILSPASGVVVLQERREGEWVEPGTPLVQIVEIHRLRIEGFIPIAVASPQLVGRAADAEIVIGETTHKVTGQVTFVSPESILASGLVRVYLEIENPEGHFRPGMRVEPVIRPEPE